MGLKIGGPTLRPDLDMATQVSVRLQAMDEQGIDVEALSINPSWYKPDRDLAKQVCQVQNEKLAAACAANPERFVAFATVALQHPELAAEQLEEGVKKYGLRGAGIGGNVAGEEISDPKFHPFWAKAEQLGVVVFIHPQGDGAPAQLQQRFKGNGYLGNVIGNPLETTIALSHLIFDGTLDKFPGLKIFAAHAGGFLPSYSGRSDFGCPTRPDLCPGGTHGPIKKKPTEYLKQLYYDTMVFNAGRRPPPGRRGGREPARGGHRFPVSVDDDPDGSHPPDAGPERRRPRRRSWAAPPPSCWGSRPRSRLSRPTCPGSVSRRGRDRTDPGRAGTRR